MEKRAIAEAAAKVAIETQLKSWDFTPDQDIWIHLTRNVQQRLSITFDIDTMEADLNFPELRALSEVQADIGFIQNGTAQQLAMDFESKETERYQPAALKVEALRDCLTRISARAALAALNEPNIEVEGQRR